MKKVILLVPAAAAVLFSGCASGENSIISMDLGGAVIVEDSLVIDETARTITAAIEPVDISNIIPAFELSANAAIGDITLEDGVASACTVTAEDGTTSEWVVTVTVKPGVSFTYDGVFESFVYGVLDSSDSDASDDYGNGVPSYSACTTGQSGDIVLAFREEYDLTEDKVTDSEWLIMMLSNESTTTSALSWTNSFTFAAEGYIIENTDSLGNVGDFVTGTFLGTLEDAEGETVTITDGFYKLLRIADDSGTIYLNW